MNRAHRDNRAIRGIVDPVGLVRLREHAAVLPANAGPGGLSALLLKRVTPPGPRAFLQAEMQNTPVRPVWISATPSKTVTPPGATRARTCCGPHMLCHIDAHAIDAQAQGQRIRGAHRSGGSGIKEMINPVQSTCMVSL